MKRGFLSGIIFHGGLALFGQELPSLSSDEPVVYDVKQQCSVAKGNAEFNNRGLRVQADCIYYFAENAKTLAQGNVRITNSQLRAAAPSGTYTVREKMLEAESFRLEILGHGIRGKNLQGPVDCLTADNVVIDYNSVERDLGGIHITARKGELHGREYFALRDAVFHVGKIPVFYTPYYRHNFDESTLRWTADWSCIRRDKHTGRYYRNDVLFNMGWAIKPGIMFDYYRKHEFLVGAIAKYDGPVGRGKFRAARIHDGDLEVYHHGKDRWLKNPRYYLEWQHQGSWGPSTDVTVQMEWMRDKNFLKDYRPDDNDGARQHPDNFAEISHREDNSVLSVLTRYRFNHFQHIQERLPEIKFDYLPVRLGPTPLYYQYGLGVSHLRERPLNLTAEERILRRVDAFAGITIPIDLHPCCTLTPVLGARVAQYWGLSKNPQHPSYTRALGQIGFDLRFRMYGDYTYENDYWNIHSFRHLLQPVIQYRYIPRGHQGDSKIPAIDREALEGRKPSLQEIDLLNRRDIDDFNDIHLLRFGLENFLYTNYEYGQGKQWMHLNFYQDMRLQHSMDNGNKQPTLAHTFMDFQWSPASFFSLSQFLRVDPNKKRLQESSTSLSLAEGDLWRLSLGHSYTQDGDSPSNQNSLTLSYRLNSTNVVAASIRLDAHKPDLISQVYTWTTLLAQTWNFKVEVEWKKRHHPVTASSPDSWKIRFLLTFTAW